MDLPPWEGSGMVKAMPEAVQRALHSRVRFLNDETGLAYMLAELGAQGPSGEVIIGAGLNDEPINDRLVVSVSASQYPWLEDHRINGEAIVPFAVALDYAVAAAQRLGLGPALTLSDIEINDAISVPATNETRLAISGRRSGTSAEIRIERAGKKTQQPALRLRAKTSSDALPALVPPAGGASPALPLSEFYQQRTFHGPTFRVLNSVADMGPAHAVALLRAAQADTIPSSVLDVLSLDAMLQLCAYWASVKVGRIGLPTGADEVRVFGRPEPGAELRMILHLWVQK